MDYKKIYNKIIERSKNRSLCSSYYEKHHIIPKSLNGSDDDENIAILTAREHYICHLLLTKMYPEGTNEWIKMIKAFGMMIWQHSNHQYRYVSNRNYEKFKIEFAQAMSLSQKGKNNNQYGTYWIYNQITKQNKKIAITKNPPDGWLKGRVLDWDKFENKNIQKHNREQIKLDKWREIMYYYRDNNISMRELSKKFNIGVNSYVIFKKYFPEEYEDIVKNKPMNSNRGKGKYN